MDFVVKNNIKLAIESILKNRDMFPIINDYVLKTKNKYNMLNYRNIIYHNHYI